MAGLADARPDHGSTESLSVSLWVVLGQDPAGAHYFDPAHEL